MSFGSKSSPAPPPAPVPTATPTTDTDKQAQEAKNGRAVAVRDTNEGASLLNTNPAGQQSAGDEVDPLTRKRQLQPAAAGASLIG